MKSYTCRNQVFKWGTTMPLVIAGTFLGVCSGDMLPENAHAIVGAAVITVTVLPVLALLLRAKGEGARLQGIVAIFVHRAADLALAQFSRFIGFVAEKASRNLRFQDLLKSNYNVFWSEFFLSCNRRIGV